MSNSQYLAKVQHNKRLVEEKEARRVEFMKEISKDLKDILDISKADYCRASKKKKIAYAEQVRNKTLNQWMD